ncbi:hypothetical protein AB595_11715 [Massilia sp. WF1]|uniref:hypothetical protein n=1 Tax=unclassified Massilia TaxID=2609279 RepID=UPI0006495580|nr:MULTISPECIES: hypothetical protein [unclassified Massilia]ALK97284.1 hypothetical protein AM586_14600 [Massilia sp. WG5]KLU36464.1 hypothetical protein AB595_11715 [Massilia sp. WF1]
MEKRTDYKTALLIEAVIHETPATGMPAAARRLAEIGVPVDVALRVLTRPVERRQQFESPFMKREAS